MSERYYIAGPLQPGQVVLDGAEAHHLAVVCRVRLGDRVTLFCGDGQEYPAQVTEATKRQVCLDLAAPRTPRRELSFSVEVAAPLPKGDRAQFLIEKLTELGVTTFVPLSCQRSVVHPREGRQEKMHRYVIEASKQCGRNVLMEVVTLTDWDEYCARKGPASLDVVAHPAQEGYPGQPGRLNDLPPAQRYRLAVGPEGGFTDDEICRAVAGGWRPLELGPRILRVETAAIVLATLVISR